MYILGVISWIIVTTPHILCGIFVLAVSAEITVWPLTKDGYDNNCILLICVTIMPIAGEAWLISNMREGLIGLLICFVVFSFRDNEYGVFISSNTREDYWDRLHGVLYLLQSVVGIYWLWSHRQLLPYIVVYVSLAYVLTFTILFIAGLGKDNTFRKQVIQILKIINDTFLFGVVLLAPSVGAKISPPIFRLCRNCFIDVIHSMLSRRYTSSFTARSSTTSSAYQKQTSFSTSNQVCDSGTMSSVSTTHGVLTSNSSSGGTGIRFTRSSTYSRIGNNVNSGCGKQTIEGTNKADTIQYIHANKARDISFNTLITRSYRKRYLLSHCLLTSLVTAVLTHYISSMNANTNV